METFNITSDHTVKKDVQMSKDSQNNKFTGEAQNKTSCFMRN